MADAADQVATSVRNVGAVASLTTRSPDDPGCATVSTSRLFATTDTGERVLDPQPTSTTCASSPSKLAALELSVQMSLRLRQPPTGVRLAAWERIAAELAARGIETDPATLHGLGFALLCDDELKAAQAAAGRCRHGRVTRSHLYPADRSSPLPRETPSRGEHDDVYSTDRATRTSPPRWRSSSRSAARAMPPSNCPSTASARRRSSRTPSRRARFVTGRCSRATSGSASCPSARRVPRHAREPRVPPARRARTARPASPGPVGPQGPAGPPTLAALDHNVSEPVSVAPGATIFGIVACDADQSAVGGGVSSSGDGMTVDSSYPSGPTGWQAFVRNEGASPTFNVSVVCTGASDVTATQDPGRRGAQLAGAGYGAGRRRLAPSAPPRSPSAATSTGGGRSSLKRCGSIASAIRSRVGLAEAHAEPAAEDDDLDVEHVDDRGHAGAERLDRLAR